MHIKNTRKYIDFRQTIIFVLLLSIFLLPSYLAIDFGGIMFSIQRIIAIVACAVCILDKKRIKSIISKKVIFVIWTLYLTFTYVSGLFAGNILDKSWLGIILEQYIIFILITYYCVYKNSAKSLIKVLQVIAYILCFLGLLEFYIGSSFYAALQTTSREIWTGNYVRGGIYRIMGPFNHALAYGLVLIILFPLSCYDTKKNKIDLKQNIILEILIIINIFLTGSRSTIIVLIAEMIFLFFMSNVRKKVQIIASLFVIVSAIALYMNFVENEITVYLRHILFSISDILFGSNLTVLNIYNANVTLSYRLNLLNLFFSKDIHPFFGNGFEFSLGYSIDNFYVSLFMKTGWFGLLNFIAVVGYIIIKALKNVRKDYIKILGISALGYCMHLFFVNELHTISGLFIILGMMNGAYMSEKKEKISYEIYN